MRDVPIAAYDVGLLQAIASCTDVLPRLLSFRPNFEFVNYQFGATENSIKSLTLLVLEEFLHIVQEHKGDGFPKEKICKLHHATRDEKRCQALRKREKLLQGLGIRQELSSDGGE
ncbi:hypothetical protein GIB67_023924 [Kingdonia uniflora]|uniref:E3 ubiquitin ligase UBR4 C-terminal domain-containing protein n=1 Tax=Kingdonia uniflora TaxID=39325 RepID=A0A7J7NWH6_9MAGN|nr:hypothetical protein GIB67_036962 [Kingdonia uniflora]KAF6174119.1 hypothetical protein GIB67_023924 [Kingdonia uniflora]